MRYLQYKKILAQTMVHGELADKCSHRRRCSSLKWLNATFSFQVINMLINFVINITYQNFIVARPVIPNDSLRVRK